MAQAVNNLELAEQLAKGYVSEHEKMNNIDRLAFRIRLQRVAQQGTRPSHHAARLALLLIPS